MCSLPPLSDSLLEDSNEDENHGRSDVEAENEIWADFDKITESHRSNFKIGHINANGIGGFKLHVIKRGLLSGRFDILAITETKLDATFPSSQFLVEGYRLCRRDRNAHGGGLMIYVTSNICFTEVKQFKGLSSSVRSNFRTESLVLKVKLAITVVAIYRPPSVPKLQWKYELSALFEAATALTSDVILAGDFNADLIKPDMPPHDGRDLLHLLDIFNLHNVIKSATRKAKTSATFLNLILTNNMIRILTSGVVDTQISDHSLVYTVLRASAPQSRSRKICFRSMKNFTQEQFLRDLRSALST